MPLIPAWQMLYRDLWLRWTIDFWLGLVAPVIDFFDA
jgi:hypothetical protein